jgi:MinD-like ATPase involved in chromosome partitioning or flagellar assembly
MPEPSVALVFSPELWVEALHRHLSHHGGARVRQIVVEPSVALEEDYDVLVVSDRWPALTFGFVTAVHSRGRSVLGVFDPEEPAGKDHLRALGVDATIAADADAAEFVLALAALRGATGRVVAPADHPASDVDPSGVAPDLGALVAVCGPRGSGVTEVALGLAVGALSHHRSVLLLDAHESAPSLATRLGVGLDPHLGKAVDACAHGLGELDDCEVLVSAGTGAPLRVVPGHATSRAATQVTTRDVLDVVAAVRSRHDLVVVDLEARSLTERAVAPLADVVVGVMGASPVAVVRGVDWLVEQDRTGMASPVHLVVNRAPSSRYVREEIRREVERTVRPRSFAWCPHDRAVEAAAWDGAPVARGGFRAACDALAATFVPGGPRRSRRWRRPR